MSYDFSDLDAYKSKTCLAKDLRITNKTLHKYHKIAMNSIADFGNDYPSIDGEVNTRMSLTKYQQWVISHLYRGVCNKGSKILFDTDAENGLQYIKAKFILLFSKETYLKSLEQQKKGGDIFENCGY